MRALQSRWYTTTFFLFLDNGLCMKRMWSIRVLFPLVRKKKGSYSLSVGKNERDGFFGVVGGPGERSYLSIEKLLYARQALFSVDA